MARGFFSSSASLSSAATSTRGGWPGVPQALLALLAGGAQALSLAWPWGGQALWWLQLASMMVLAALVLPPVAGAGRRVAAPGRRGAWLGGLFATAWLCGTFWWLFISMHNYGGLAAPLAAAAVLGLALFLASYYALALGLFSRYAGANPWLIAILFAAVWLLAELARGVLWTGFPWGASGYAHVDGPLAPLARSIGVYGLSAVAAALSMGAVLALRSLLGTRPAGARRQAGRRGVAAVGTVVVLAAVLVGAAVQRHCATDQCHVPGFVPADAPPSAASSPPLTLALLQGNIPQDEKFESGSGVPLALQWYAQALRAARADLVVAPETAIPLLPQQLLPGYLEGLSQHFAQGPQAALLGIPLGNETLGYTNSAWGLSPATAQEPYRYDKHHLVPFGEFIPPFFRWFTAMMDIPLGDFNRGAVGQPSFAWAGQRIAPNICYEDLFGEELGARFIDPAQAPTVFVNLSNIGWFGDTVAIDQHLHISRMRALEFERPMVRATNTGATAIIDHRGVVTDALARHTRGVLTGQVQGRGLNAQEGWSITPYAWWVARWGLSPLWLLGVLVLLFCAIENRAKRPRQDSF